MAMGGEGQNNHQHGRMPHIARADSSTPQLAACAVWLPGPLGFPGRWSAACPDACRIDWQE
jgi:hypothetical protein